MSSTITTWFTFLLGLTVFPNVVDSQPNVQIRNGQYFSRFRCPNIGNKVVCADDNPTKAYNCSSREQCCANCNSLDWKWFNFIDNEDQTKPVGGECQLFDQKPKRVALKTRCSLYKSDSTLLSQVDIISICYVVVTTTAVVPTTTVPWTTSAPVVIMYRPSTASSWNLLWASYKNGFTLADGGYWLGLEQVHQLTSLASYRLLVEFLCSGSSVWTSVQYQLFAIGDEVNTQYKLSVSGYAGSAGDHLTLHNGMKFSTSDRDNDIYSGDCVALYPGGWWFSACLGYCYSTAIGSSSFACWGCGFTALRMSIILNQ